MDVLDFGVGEVDPRNPALIEAHGGRIWVEAEDGRSAISFSVPTARQAPARTRG